MDDFVFVENIPINIKKKIKLVQKILKEFNIKTNEKDNTLFYRELDNLKVELGKYLKTCDDPLDEIVRLMFSTIPQTIKDFTKGRDTIKFLQNKELVGDFFKDDEYYALIGDITYYYSSLYKVPIKDILFQDIIPHDCNIFHILFHILSNLEKENYSNFILLSIKMKIIKLKLY